MKSMKNAALAALVAFFFFGSNVGAQQEGAVAQLQPVAAPATVQPVTAGAGGGIFSPGDVYEGVRKGLVTGRRSLGSLAEEHQRMEVIKDLGGGKYLVRMTGGTNNRWCKKSETTTTIVVRSDGTIRVCPYRLDLEATPASEGECLDSIPETVTNCVVAGNLRVADGGLSGGMTYMSNTFDTVLKKK